MKRLLLLGAALFLSVLLCSCSSSGKQPSSTQQPSGGLELLPEGTVASPENTEPVTEPLPGSSSLYVGRVTEADASSFTIAVSGTSADMAFLETSPFIPYESLFTVTASSPLKTFTVSSSTAVTVSEAKDNEAHITVPGNETNSVGSPVISVTAGKSSDIVKGACVLVTCNGDEATGVRIYNFPKKSVPHGNEMVTE